jgi:hypothetical protein
VVLITYCIYCCSLLLDEGISACEKSQPVGREGLSGSCGNLLQQNKPEDIANRLALCVAFAAAGRTGEVAATTYTQLKWDQVNGVLAAEWNEMKTSLQKPMTFVADFSDYRICVFHALASYWVVGAGSSAVASSMGLHAAENIHVLPHLRTEAVAKINKVLKDIQGRAPSIGLPEDVTGTCLRVGAVHEILNHPSCELIHAIIRGGWEFSSLCNIFEYIMGTKETLSIGGRALAGYPEPRRRTYPPRLSACIDGNNDIAINVLKTVLFHSNHFDILKCNDLNGLVDTMLASLLQYLNVILTNHTMDNLIVVTIVRAALDIDDKVLSLENLLVYGKKIQDDFTLRNSSTIISHLEGPVKDAVQILKDELLRSREDVEVLKAQVQKQDKLLVTMDATLQETLRLVRNIAAHVTPSTAMSSPFSRSLPSPTKKRSSPSANKKALIAEEEICASSVSSTNKSVTSGPSKKRMKKVFALPTDDGGLIAKDTTLNAFTALRRTPKPPLVKFGMGSELDLHMVVEKWFKYELQMESTDWESPTWQEKGRIKNVMTKALSIATPRDLKDLMSEEPKKTDPTWSDWRKSFVAAAVSVQVTMTEYLTHEEVLTFGCSTTPDKAKKNTITAMDGRLFTLKNPAKKRAQLAAKLARKTK